MNREKVTMIVLAQINPEGKESLAVYIELSAPIFKEAGGVPVNKYKITGQLLGENPLSLVSVMEFPSIEVLNAVFENEKYKALIDLRNKAFLKLEILYSSSLE